MINNSQQDEKQVSKPSSFQLLLEKVHQKVLRKPEIKLTIHCFAGVQTCLEILHENKKKNHNCKHLECTRILAGLFWFGPMDRNSQGRNRPSAQTGWSRHSTFLRRIGHRTICSRCQGGQRTCPRGRAPRSRNPPGNSTRACRDRLNDAKETKWFETTDATRSVVVFRTRNKI